MKRAIRILLSVVFFSAIIFINCNIVSAQSSRVERAKMLLIKDSVYTAGCWGFIGDVLEIKVHSVDDLLGSNPQARQQFYNKYNNIKKLTETGEL